MNYDKLAVTAQRIIRADGRPLEFYKIDNVVADATKPWRGAGAVHDTEKVLESGVFIVGNTSIPTKSRGLAFDWIDEDLLKISRHVCFVPALGLPDLTDYKTIVDPINASRWSIIWGQCMQPGGIRMFYVFGLAQ